MNSVQEGAIIDEQSPRNCPGCKKGALVADSLSFGIGCFHFGLKKKPPVNITKSEYIKEVESFLQAIPNASNITIEEDLSVIKEFRSEKQISPLAMNPFTFVPYSELHFEVYIPFRLQKELSERTIVFESTPTERFRVSIFSAYHCPVTFVELIGAPDASSPSAAVAIVREFLKDQNSRGTSTNIEFQSLGPSPFHADLYIKRPEEANEDTSWFFWRDEIEMPGYNTIEFYFDRNNFASIEEARDFIFDAVKDELGLFYHIQQLDNETVFNIESGGMMGEKMTSQCTNSAGKVRLIRGENR